MQLTPKHKQEKEAKAKVAEDKRLATIAQKIEREAKKQEKAITSAKVKANKVAAKADELRRKLSDAMTTEGGEVAPVDAAAQHTKSKSRTGSSTLVTQVSIMAYLSPKGKE